MNIFYFETKIENKYFFFFGGGGGGGAVEGNGGARVSDFFLTKCLNLK